MFNLKSCPFDLRVEHNNKTKRFSAQGDVLTTRMTSALKRLQLGDQVSFESCLVSLPDGSVRAFPNLTLQVSS